MNKDIAYIKIYTFNIDNKKCEKVNIIEATNFDTINEETLQEISQQLKEYQPNISFISK